MKIVRELRKAFLPLMKDRGFASMMIVCGLIGLTTEALVLSIIGYFCFYLPEMFVSLVDMLKEHWLEHMTTLTASIALIVFGIYLRRKNPQKEGGQCL